VLRPADELTLPTLSFLGVGLRRVTPEQHHVAFVYQAADGTPCLSHLAFHRRFRGADAWDGLYHWSTAVGIDELNRKTVAAWLSALAQNPPIIDYGLSFVGCEFVRDQNGTYSFTAKERGKGVTCATFIMLVLQTLGLPLIEQDTWPARPEDVQWQQRILDALQPHMAPEELALVAQDVGCARYRPIEIAAACSHDPWPVNYETAVQLAQEILAEVVDVRLAAGIH
jgi:hypothetical protein